MFSICALLAGAAVASEVIVLSAGAIEPGLRAAVADFQQATIHRARVTFNTAPQIRKRIDAGERWDVVIAPPAVLDDLARAGKVQRDRANVGRVGVGVAVRSGAPAPDVSTVPALQRAMVDADAVVFNRASTGMHVEQWLRKAGLYDQLGDRVVRYDDGASVMEHVLKSTGREIAFGAMTEILLYRDRGLQFVGPLPSAIQNYTSYAAATTGTGGAPAEVLVHFLGSPRGREAFKAAGVE